MYVTTLIALVLNDVFLFVFCVLGKSWITPELLRAHTTNLNIVYPLLKTDSTHTRKNVFWHLHWIVVLRYFIF